VTTASGPVLFARYAYPPNALGYCGPGDPAALLGAAATADDRELGAMAERFEGAWPYLQLIAACNGLTEPLDRRVVEAYWVGNELLDRVPAGLLLSSLEHRFARRAGRDFPAIAQAAATATAPCHCFHVFAVYPWVGLLRAGMTGPALEVLDRCRVRWGTVTQVDGDLLTVHSRLLELDGSRLALGPPTSEVVRAAAGGLRLAGDLVPGDIVSLHWDWVCDRLAPPALARLRRFTASTLAAVNALPAPGPAVAAARG
jgi:hypothetical protein